MKKPLTVREAAKELGVGRQQIYNLIANGKLKATKNYHIVFVNRDSVEARKHATK